MIESIFFNPAIWIVGVLFGLFFIVGVFLLVRGFSRQDFRDLVESTEGYDKNYRVTFEDNGKVLKVTEVKSTFWTSKGRKEENK